MALVDERGRLFGVVNVIDLAVVVLVVATLAAGAAFVLLDGLNSGPPEERYLTVVLDDPPRGGAPVLDGETVRPPQGSVRVGRTDARVTDRYVVPVGRDRFVTVARLRVTVSGANADRTNDTQLVTDGGTYVVGQRLELVDDPVRYTGYVHAVGRSDANLSTGRVEATLVTRLPSSVAERVQGGDVQRVAGREVARVTAVERRAIDDDRTRLEVTVSLRVFETERGPLYGTQRVQPGAEIRVAPDGYELTGTVTEVA